MFVHFLLYMLVNTASNYEVFFLSGQRFFFIAGDKGERSTSGP